MKKIIYSLGILAAAAFAFSSCQKEQPIKDEIPGENLVTVSFTAEKAGVDTKTAAVEGSTSEGVSYIWTDEDAANMKLFIVGEDGGNEVLTPVANPTVTKVSDTKLTISGQVAPNATYTFRAVLAGKWTNDGTKPRVSDIQNPSATNFDPSADVLVSDDMEVVVGSSEEPTVATSALEMSFRRLVVVNKMTLKNMVEGENISKIVITSTKNLTGYYTTNNLTATGDKKTITLNYTSASVPSGGQFPVYFTTIPETGHVLTVEVTTDQFIYTKSFTTGKSIDFNIGQFTKFNFALPAGVANTALTLPVEDDMSWALVETESTTELGAADLTAMQGTKKIYDSASKAYKSVDGIKLGTSSVRGSITTNNINLSSAFYVAIDAKTYGTDASKIVIQVDGTDVYTSADALTSSYDTYYVNCDAATATSKVTITSDGDSKHRLYINNLVIGSGTYAPKPKINVTSANPLEVANTASAQTITYTIDNATSATLTASTEATWITGFSYPTSGSVSFNVAAQETAAAAREAIITLAYAEAKSVNVTVRQAAGAGAAVDYTTLETSNVTLTAGTNGSSATVDGEEAIKVGTSSKGGDMTVTVPSGTTKLHVHAAAWKGVTGLSLNITGATCSPSSIALTADDGITNNSPFTLSGDPEDFYFELTLSGITAETDITFEPSSAKRFVVWGVNAEAVVDNRGEVTLAFATPSYSFVVNSTEYSSFAYQTATATSNSSPITIGISYSISDPNSVTSGFNTSTGAFTLSGNTGIATITASFDGNDDYKPATDVSYTVQVKPASVDYTTLQTSNVTLTAGTNGSTATVNTYDAIKVGTSSKGGDMSVTVPAGTTKLHVHAAAWKGVTGLSLNISGATCSPSSIALTADDGIANNSPFTLSGDPEDFYFELTLSNITAETTITFTTSTTKRFVIWGVNAE